MPGLSGPYPLVQNAPARMPARPEPTSRSAPDLGESPESASVRSSAARIAAAPKPPWPVPDSRLRPPDPDMLTGPTPAFEASLLEVQSDLRRVLERFGTAMAQAAYRANDLPRAAPRPPPDDTADPATDAARTPDPTANHGPDPPVSG